MYLVGHCLLFLYPFGFMCQQVRFPPTIKTKMQDPIYARKFAKLDLPCEASGVPTPTYKWYESNTLLSMSGEYEANGLFGGLSIKGFDPIKHRLFHCTATNYLGTAISYMIIVRAAVLGYFPRKSPSHKHVPEGDSLTLQCEPPFSKPRSAVSWILKPTGSRHTGREARIGRGDRVSVNYNGDLYFAYVQKSDEKPGFTYYCQLENPVFQVIHWGSPVQITTSQNQKGIFERKPTMLFASSNTIALRSKDVILECIFGGLPTPTVSWSRRLKGLDTSRTKISQNGHSMVISHIEWTDEDVYSCTATNSAGTFQHSIEVKVEAAPYWAEETSSDMNVTMGTDVTVVCSALGRPIASLLMSSNGKKMTGFTTIEEGKKIEYAISNIPVNGSRVFQCLSVNKWGSALKNIYVNVLDRTIITKTPLDIRVFPNQIVQFTCDGKSDPMTTVTYSWTGGESALISHHIQDNGKTLTIDTSKGDFSGHYVCTVSNGYSSVNATARLSYLIRPPSSDLKNLRSCQCSIHSDVGSTKLAGPLVYRLPTLVYGKQGTWMNNSNVFRPFIGGLQVTRLTRQDNKVTCLKLIQRCPNDCKLLIKQLLRNSLATLVNTIASGTLEKYVGQIMCENHQPTSEIKPPGKKLVMFYTPDAECGVMTSFSVLGQRLCCRRLYIPGVIDRIIWNNPCVSGGVVGKK